MVKGAIVVDQLMKTSLERVWACGDITTFDGKLKLIATGFAESAIAVAQAVHEIRPEVRIQPKYSTNTGVPGVVAGQPVNEAAAGDRSAVEALREADPVLRAVIDEVGPMGCRTSARAGPSDHYATLVRSIVGPAALDTAPRRDLRQLLDRFGGRRRRRPRSSPTIPTSCAPRPASATRRSRYLRSLAEHVLDGSLELDHLDELPDEEVIAELVAVKGIGLWSAQMFLMLHLRRPDVLPVGDLGIRKAVMIRYGLPALPGPAEVDEIGEPWRPYRTLASLFLWRSLRATPV